MILFGCLLAFGAAVAPRVILVLAWIFSDRWARVWQGDFLLPLLGIVFLPYTTIMYMLSVTVLPGGGTTIENFGWFWILLGLLLDFMKWGQVITNRRAGTEYATKYYPDGAPGAATMQSSSSTGSVPPSTSATAVDKGTSKAADSSSTKAAGSEDSTDSGGSSKSGGSDSS